jgi:large subunit ribosomal protein L15
MVRRHERKFKKYLGSRTWGAGNTKKRRGGGCKGGKGYSGSHKHKWLHIIKYEPEHFGKRGFTSLKQKRKRTEKVINVGDIELMIKDGKLEKVDNFYNFEFDGKILGRGELSFPVRIKALSFSKSAKEKIERAGGVVA